MKKQTTGQIGGTVYDWYPAENAGEGTGVITLIHGLGLARSLWNGHIAALRKTHHVLAYDLLGHGETALPSSAPDLTRFAFQLCQLLDGLQIASSHLVGFSLGGMINRRFAMDHAERADSLVIMNSPHERSAEAQRLVEQRAADTSAGGPAATIDETLRRWFTPTFLTEQRHQVDLVRQQVLANDPSNYAACRKVLACGVTELIRPQPPLRHPAFVMTCENDSGSTPAMSRAIASEIAGASLEIIPDLQHLGLIERPDLFCGPILQFIDSLADPVNRGTG